MRRLQKAVQGKLNYIELVDGSRHWFEPDKAYVELFRFFSDSLGAVYHGEVLPQPPEVLKAVARARDREKALRTVYPEGISPWIPLDVDALASRGEYVPRHLVAGRAVVDVPVPDLSEQ